MIVVHGGAGSVEPERHERLRAGVRAAAAAGQGVLARGATALDAVVAAVRVLEDDPEFAAGVGSALTRVGTVETCASVMDGATRRAGAVVAVPDLAAPSLLARIILERGEQVVLAGAAALQLASEIGIAPAPTGALITPRAMQQLADARAGNPPGDGGGVGVVARDQKGGFAAATSAGGTVMRRPGSVDDSSIPGVGTWADGKVAISTSCGDAAFRVALAHDIAERIAHGDSLRSAAKDALVALHKLVPDATAGVILVGESAWCAIQLGPHMPVAWVDDAGASDAMGFKV